MSAQRNIGVQLYSFRNELEKNYAGVIGQVADMGFTGVEPAGYPGCDVHTAKALYQDLGLAVPSIHAPLPEGDNEAGVIEQIDVLGVDKVIHSIMTEGFATEDDIKKSAEAVNASALKLGKHNVKVGYHNHAWEFETVGGVLKWDMFRKELSDDVFFEIDTYWVKVGGQNPAQLVESIGAEGKAPFLHIKDGPGVAGEANVAVGSGVMDWKPILEGAHKPDWYLVEFDRCDTDVLEAARQSVEYLKGV